MINYTDTTIKDDKLAASFPLRDKSGAKIDIYFVATNFLHPFLPTITRYVS